MHTFVTRRACCCIRSLATRQLRHVTSSTNPRTAREAADKLSNDWDGRSLVRKQLVDGNQVQRLAWTLGKISIGDVNIDTLDSPATGTPIPPGYSLVYFTPGGIESDLGRDGTDKTFNAPDPFSRRMWAGGRLKWPAWGEKARSAGPDLRVGDEVEEETRLISATPKVSSTSGAEMVLVEVEKLLHGPRGLAITDRRSWIFSPEIPTNAPPSATMALGNVEEKSTMQDVSDGTSSYPIRHMSWSPVALFRFSALTFNAHKIHYNESWTKAMEGQPGIVVHGPLNLINMLEYWRDVHGQSGTPGEISYRARSPLFAGQRYEIGTESVSEEQGKRKWEIAVKRGDQLCMTGTVLA